MRLDVSKGLSQDDLQTPIGKFVVPCATAFHEEMSIEEVLVILRKRKIEHMIFYFYSVDDNRKLTGILSTRDLLLSEPSSKLSDLVDPDVLRIEEAETVENGLKFLETHGLQAIPVVDSSGHLKGLFELVPESDQPEGRKSVKGVTSRDIHQLIGQSLHLGKLDSSVLEYRYRMPWLFCTIVAGLVCATVGSAFSTILSKYVVLAMFIPLVLSLGESVAMQSMSLSLQFLHFGKTRWRPLFRRIIVEGRTAVLLGLTSALLVSSVFWAWHTSFQTMIAVTASIFMAMIFSTTLGSLFPIILHSCKLDAKVASGPVVLMLTDISATITYLFFSNWLLTTFG